jgi:hypothetical protein
MINNWVNRSTLPLPLLRYARAVARASRTTVMPRHVVTSNAAFDFIEEMMNHRIIEVDILQSGISNGILYRNNLIIGACWTI